MCVESQYTINGVTYNLYLGHQGNDLRIVTLKNETIMFLYEQGNSNPDISNTTRARKYLAALGADVLAALMMGLIENAEGWK